MPAPHHHRGSIEVRIPPDVGTRAAYGHHVTTQTTTTARTSTVLYTIVPSPIDPLVLTGDGDGVTGLFMSPAHGGPLVHDDWRPRGDAFRDVVEQLHAYFARELTVFDVALRPTGTPFQTKVWDALREIPYGQTTSYGELARRVGNANAPRAVGLANGRNPISIIVPCHRVIGADGRLIGYGGGLARKRFLLELEQRDRRLL